MITYFLYGGDPFAELYYVFDRWINYVGLEPNFVETCVNVFRYNNQPSHSVFVVASGYMIFTVSYLPNLMRLTISLVFITSFLLKPLITLLSLIWARVDESDKPVFTLIFGGASALATAISEAAKHPSG
jgi:hypothetical protein